MACFGTPGPCGGGGAMSEGVPPLPARMDDLDLAFWVDDSDDMIEVRHESTGEGPAERRREAGRHFIDLVDLSDLDEAEMMQDEMGSGVQVLEYLNANVDAAQIAFAEQARVETEAQLADIAAQLQGGESKGGSWDFESRSWDFDDVDIEFFLMLNEDASTESTREIARLEEQDNIVDAVASRTCRDERIQSDTLASGPCVFDDLHSINVFLMLNEDANMESAREIAAVEDQDKKHDDILKIRDAIMRRDEQLQSAAKRKPCRAPLLPRKRRLCFDSPAGIAASRLLFENAAAARIAFAEQHAHMRELQAQEKALWEARRLQKQQEEVELDPLAEVEDYLRQNEDAWNYEHAYLRSGRCVSWADVGTHPYYGRSRRDFGFETYG